MFRFGILIFGIMVSFGCASQNKGSDVNESQKPEPMA
jgi:hypothetical protein